MSVTIEQVSKLTIHNGSVYALCKGSTDDDFFSAGGEGIVVNWNVDALNKPTAVAKVESQVFSLLYLPKKNHLLIGTMSGGLHVVDLESKKEIHFFTHDEQSIFGIAEKGDNLFSLTKDGRLSVWNENYELQRTTAVSDLSLRTIAFHPEENVAAIGSSDGRIYLIELSEFKITGALEGPSNSVFSLAFTADGKKLLVGSRDAQLYIYDWQQKRLESQLKAHLYTINDITLLAGGNLFATASRDKTIRIWNAKTFELLKSIDAQKNDGHINSVNKLLWLPSKNYLVSSSDDRSVIVWKISSTDK